MSLALHTSGRLSLVRSGGETRDAEANPAHTGARVNSTSRFFERGGLVTEGVANIECGRLMLFGVAAFEEFFMIAKNDAFVK